MNNKRRKLNMSMKNRGMRKRKRRMILIISQN
jgi:hypothetical protein